MIWQRFWVHIFELFCSSNDHVSKQFSGSNTRHWSESWLWQVKEINCLDHFKTYIHTFWYYLNYTHIMYFDYQKQWILEGLHHWRKQLLRLIHCETLPPSWPLERPLHWPTSPATLRTGQSSGEHRLRCPSQPWHCSCVCGNLSPT